MDYWRLEGWKFHTTKYIEHRLMNNKIDCQFTLWEHAKWCYHVICQWWANIDCRCHSLIFKRGRLFMVTRFYNRAVVIRGVYWDEKFIWYPLFHMNSLPSILTGGQLYDQSFRSEVSCCIRLISDRVNTWPDRTVGNLGGAAYNTTEAESIVSLLHWRVVHVLFSTYE